ncbi:FBD domain [Arabidopsis suecica]|uniref:FBD domain n=1 Tax=Arabidopsis suecica TaxID=45249 RepID=A0A8T1Y1M5_ARASU|nr:FBD domain [Arabidopsis suecica]
MSSNVHGEKEAPVVTITLMEDMPKLEEAYVDVFLPDLESLIGSAVYVGGFVFNHLEHLKLCVGSDYAANLLVRLLEGHVLLEIAATTTGDGKLLSLSSNSVAGFFFLTEFFLRFSVATASQVNKYGGMDCWNQPSNVPECLLSSLQIFNWLGYLGRPVERDVAVYILENACHLKTATISIDDSHNPKLEMIKELSLASRASTTSQLILVDESD